MGLTFFVASAGLVIAGYFGYRKLQGLEDEIREELEARDKAEEGGAGEVAESEPVEKATSSPVDEALQVGLEALVLDKVRESPGILQTEVYGAFGGRDRKELQGLLLKMDREGRVRREKKGSTYQLFPA